MQSCVHSFFFFLPDRPTHLHEREDDGKRNILLGWPKVFIMALGPGIKATNKPCRTPHDTGT